MKQNIPITLPPVPHCLIIIDGLGVTKRKQGNAYYGAGPLFLKDMVKRYPTALLSTHGASVGLPAHVMGSSEVGHVNIGAGRIIKQDVTIIDRDIRSGKFFKNPVLLRALRKTKKEGVALHLMGLLSDGKIHADINHLFALLRIAKKERIRDV